MLNLIQAASTNPTPAKIARVAAYFVRHPMAVCMLAPSEVDQLRVWGIVI